MPRRERTQARGEEEEAERAAARGGGVHVGQQALHAGDHQRQAQPVPGAEGHRLRAPTLKPLKATTYTKNHPLGPSHEHGPSRPAPVGMAG